MAADAARTSRTVARANNEANIANATTIPTEPAAFRAGQDQLRVARPLMQSRALLLVAFGDT